MSTDPLYQRHTCVRPPDERAARSRSGERSARPPVNTSRGSLTDARAPASPAPQTSPLWCWADTHTKDFTAMSRYFSKLLSSTHEFTYWSHVLDASSWFVWPIACHQSRRPRSRPYNELFTWATSHFLTSEMFTLLPR